MGKCALVERPHRFSAAFDDVTYQLQPSIGWIEASVANLIILINQTQQVRVVLNQRNKTLASPLSFFLASGSQYIAVHTGYFTDDLYVDLLFIDSSRHTRCIYHGNGDGTYTFPPLKQ
jgi:hypothetical protein